MILLDTGIIAKAILDVIYALAVFTAGYLCHSFKTFERQTTETSWDYGKGYQDGYPDGYRDGFESGKTVVSVDGKSTIGYDTHG